MIVFSVITVLAAFAQGPPPLANVGCSVPAQGTLSQATVFRCQGEAAEREALRVTATAEERTSAWLRAVQAYRRASDLAGASDERISALEGLARLFDASHLNWPDEEEGTLREIMGVLPEALAPMFRLAQFQEARGRTDEAEDTLLLARRRKPDELEPYRQLAQFYARRAGAVQPDLRTREQVQATAVASPTPDPSGVYRVGGAVPAPRREGEAELPEAARAAGVGGSVQLEIVVSETGAVTDVAVMRSVPLLDDEAIRTVKQWRYAPTLVGGKPVPVRMDVTVTFAAP